jgi:hypothetical protein
MPPRSALETYTPKKQDSRNNIFIFRLYELAVLYYEYIVADLIFMQMDMYILRTENDLKYTFQILHVSALYAKPFSTSLYILILSSY